ncbi:hypothetical protein N482_20050 [Pseudoalteromonas luteoviolacea NCIMB 1942]|uniref:HTH marR-type domain-containing protein n=2 Tax=Pseudoalteromonas luteoviolacea TaxID=43657 RepID=A0A166Y905_9GAMM|nr:hypothetical protein N482_20050 [Pseudoalteromonas luteoviolacea NCIMB 1942]
MASMLEEELKKFDLKLAYWPTLMLLWEQEGQTQTDLTNACQTNHYTTTRVLDKLEVCGLVERRLDPSNRRVFRIFLTNKGRDLETPLTKIATNINNQVLQKLENKEQKNLLKILKSVNNV